MGAPLRALHEAAARLLLDARALCDKPALGYVPRMIASLLHDRLRLGHDLAEASMYELGRALVADAGIGPADILWDADEVLWDWAVPFGRLLSVSPKVVFGQYGHREWIALRPGMIGLLSGLHDGALEAGRDPWMRIWTAGYPWRIARITREIPALAELLGPGPGGPDEAHALATHPRLVARADLVRVMLRLLDPDEESALLAELPTPARELVARQIRERPGHGGFKLPEIAVVAGKPEIATTRILVDDTRANLDWFTASAPERAGIWVRSPTPRVLFGKVPNSLWFRPDRWLARLVHALVPAMGLALGEAARALLPAPAAAGASGGEDRRVSRVLEARPLATDGAALDRLGFPQGARSPAVFALDVPNSVFWDEWFGPMKAVKRAFKARKRRRQS